MCANPYRLRVSHELNTRPPFDSKTGGFAFFIEDYPAASCGECARYRGSRVI